MAMRKPVKKAASKKIVKKTGGSADARERNNETAFNKLYTKMHPGGGDMAEQDAVVAYAKTAREARRLGMPISNDARYYAENPKNKVIQSRKTVGKYFATKKLATKKPATKK